MATFKSKAYIGGVPFRPTEEAPFEITASILVPSGTAIAANDVFKFFDLGADVDIRAIDFRCDDLDTGTAITLHCGVDYAGATTDDNDAFFASSTIGQTGGCVRVENGGDDPFAVGGFIALPGKATVTVTCAISPTTNPATDRYLTLTARCQKKAGATADVPYIYTDRYNSSGVGSL